MESKPLKSCEEDLPGDTVKTMLFKQQRKDGETFRIPALIYIGDDQTILAFAEKRTSPSDCNAKVLVMRRGMFKDGSVQWLPLEVLTQACLQNHRTMNPCPVYNSTSKTLFLFFICVQGHISEHHQICTGKNKARLCYITSNDRGLSWSGLTDLTDSLIDSRWATFGVGPGHGTQMTNGRLIIPAYAYYKKCHPFLCFCCCVKPYALAVYSDDGGKIWQMGDKLDRESCECEMAEIVDSEGRSHLYCNARSTKGHRIEAVSESNGVDFNKSHFAPDLVEPRHGCQGSVVAFPAPKVESLDLHSMSHTPTWLVYVHPTDRRQRKDLGVYLNKTPLDTSCWSKPLVINEGPSGYSDVIYCEDEELFACVMECGKESELEEIDFQCFHLSSVLKACG